jgi:hypothetical protein
VVLLIPRDYDRLPYLLTACLSSLGSITLNFEGVGLEASQPYGVAISSYLLFLVIILGFFLLLISASKHNI